MSAVKVANLIDNMNDLEQSAVAFMELVLFDLSEVLTLLLNCCQEEHESEKMKLKMLENVLVDQLSR